jgi:hypothetical protein
MSYAWSAALQAAVYQRLVGDAALGALVGAAIYDAPLADGAVQADYVTLGEETVPTPTTGATSPSSGPRCAPRCSACPCP